MLENKIYIGELAATKVETPAAILYSDDVIWAQEAHKRLAGYDQTTVSGNSSHLF
ncbi:hypothetical protein [Paenibacillus cremeus]|uniref:hypothetical protein n=1 Tax=Paenibacillus cremeus TaxID=2163881 RepID=UPI0016461B4D|nr:hypothetical protein [Paenibacillus cremeus]